MAVQTKAFPARSVMTALDSSMARIEFEPDGTIRDANANFLRLMGYSLAEIRGRRHAMFVDEATRTSDAYRQFWDRLRDGQFQSGEFRRITKDGHSVWIRGTYNPLRGQGGAVIGVVKFAVDVTAQVEEREAVLERQQQLSEMVENTSVRLILADRSGTITYMTPPR